MMTETILLIAETEAARIDAYLAENTELSRSKLQKLIKDGAVFLNDRPCKPNSDVKTGDTIRILAPVRFRTSVARSLASAPALMRFQSARNGRISFETNPP